jgi:ammonia channel protein AmtB
MVGLVKWGEPQGGYLGIDEGTYAFQNAEVNVLWQAIGIVVAIGLGVVTAAVMAFILERTIGLRLSEEEQVAGVDGPVWGLDPDLDLYTGGNGLPSAPTPASGAPTTVPANPSSE